MKEKTIGQRLYRSSIISVLIMIIVSMGITLYYSIEWQMDQIDQRISTVADMLARMPLVIQSLEGDGTQELIAYLDSENGSTPGIDVISICNTDGIRIYHQDKNRIGKHFVGGDEARALEGEDPYITNGIGTLGDQRRAFQSVRNEDGEVIGFVMVSVFTESVKQMRNQIFLIYLLLLAFLIFVGITLMKRNMRHLEKLMMGFEPEEFVMRYIERSEVLDVLEEGVFAVDPQGVIILMNQSAKNMLKLDPNLQVEGKKLLDVYPESKLLDVMKTKKSQYNVSMVLNGDAIITSRIPLVEKNKISGAITIFRNKAEVMKLAEELTGARYMLDTLRAFNHEFMNKLHVILGYLQIGETENAMKYISNTTLVSSQSVKDVTKEITVPHLSALIIGKLMRASELGINMKLKKGSHCLPEDLFLPVDIYVTICGNLLENAIDELNSRDYLEKEIQLGIYGESDGMLIICEDTGGGIPEEIMEHIFEQGVSTKGEGRGTGLPLIKELTEQFGGEIQIETEEGVGTSITVSFVKKQTEADKEEKGCIG